MSPRSVPRPPPARISALVVAAALVVLGSIALPSLPRSGDPGARAGVASACAASP